MKVVCVLNELMRELKLNDMELARETQVDLRTIRKLRDDTAGWRLPRKALHNLTLFAYSKGYTHGIFEVRPLPLWENFRNGRTIIYREDRKWDATGEVQLRDFLGRLGSEASLGIPTKGPGVNKRPARHVEEIEHQLRNHNCVFLGSPKYSFATEIALALVWGARPFDRTPQNAERIPLFFKGMEVRHRFMKSSMIQGGDKGGFRIKVPGVNQWILVPIDRYAPEDYRAFSGKAYDATAVVASFQPLGTSRPVTTIIIGGYTGLATSIATEELIYGDPPLGPSESGNPQLAVFRFQYNKHRLPSGATGEGLRRPLKETFRWGPPWRNVVSPADLVALEAQGVK